MFESHFLNSEVWIQTSHDVDAGGKEESYMHSAGLSVSLSKAQAFRPVL